MGNHALFSPSGATKWMACPASLAMEDKYGIDSDSVYAQEGTAAHELAELALNSDHKDVGRIRSSVKKAENDHPFTEDMVEHIQRYVDNILEYAEGNELFVEEKSDFSDLIEQPGEGWGTADAIIIADHGGELQLHDLKYGFKEVDAKNNKQLMLYAAGVYHKYSLLYDIETIRLVIHQPRNGGLSEWACDVPTMLSVVEDARAAAVKVKHCFDKGADRVDDSYFSPGETQCQWCKAKSSCPALQKFVEEAIDTEQCDVVFDDMTNAPGADIGERFAALLPKLPVIESWLKAVYADAEHFALDGGHIPGHKVIQGRKGNRVWTDETTVEELFETMRVKKDERYVRKLISPARAEKLFGDSERRWKRLEEQITQAPGKPKLVLESHKQPAMQIETPVVFDNLDTYVKLNSKT